MIFAAILTGAAIRDSDQKHYHHVRDYIATARFDAELAVLGLGGKLLRCLQSIRLLRRLGLRMRGLAMGATRKQQLVLTDPGFGCGILGF